MDRDEATRLLRNGKAGVDVWNASRVKISDRVNWIAAWELGVRKPGDAGPGWDFRGVDLPAADLRGINLSGVDLRGSNLRGAVLNGADLFGANLDGADLSHAQLFGALLIHTRVAGTDLQSAIFGHTFVGCDLTTAHGVASIRHVAPSRFLFEVLRDASNPWPLGFLRGCGLSDLEIETVGTLSRSAIEYYSAFISYSSKDDAFAVKLHDALQARGVRCWLDKHEVLPGDNIYRAVNDGIRLWDKVLLCCSKDSLSSWWVKDEVTRALEKEQRLEKERGRETLAVIPLDLDGRLFADDGGFEYGATLRKRHAARFAGWDSMPPVFDAEVAKLVLALRADDAARPSVPPSRL